MPRKKQIKTTTKEVRKKTPAKKRKDYIYAVGRRKTSVARVRLIKNGTGDIVVNQKPYNEYFPTFEFQQIVIKPLEMLDQKNKVDISVKVQGGGKRGQAESTRHGISRALIQINENWRKTLKPFGFLTRDPRKKERKKPGLKRARRAPQWQKR